jgi:hypothetical protein
VLRSGELQVQTRIPTYQMSLHHLFTDRRNSKPLGTHTQKVDGPGLKTSVMTSDLAILAFLPIELGFVDELTQILSLIKLNKIMNMSMLYYLGRNMQI